MIDIIRYNNKYQNDVINLILHCQNDGIRPTTNIMQQQELLDIENYYFKDDGYFWCAIDKGHLVGTIGLKNYRNGIADLKKFFVKEEYRGKPHHLGQKLYAEFLKYAKDKEFNTIILSTHKSTERAHKFYSKAGFILTDAADMPVVIDTPFCDSDYYVLKI